MGIFIIVVCVVMFVISFNYQANKNTNEGEKNLGIVANSSKPIQKNHLKFVSGTYRYYGGLNEITDKCGVSLMLMENEYLLLNLVGQKKKELKIPLENIIEISTKMQDEISRDVTLSRLLLVGVFAFGLKKERHNIQKFLLIKYLDSKTEERKIILGEYNHPERTYMEIQNELDKLKGVQV